MRAYALSPQPPEATLCDHRIVVLPFSTLEVAFADEIFSPGVLSDSPFLSLHSGSFVVSASFHLFVEPNGGLQDNLIWRLETFHTKKNIYIADHYIHIPLKHWEHRVVVSLFCFVFVVNFNPIFNIQSPYYNSQLGDGGDTTGTIVSVSFLSSSVLAT